MMTIILSALSPIRRHAHTPLRRYILPILAFGLILTGAVQDKVGLPTEALAQVGSSITSDGTAPNDNAMLDVQSPSTGTGKGILIPRVTVAQRTTANASLAGGLLDGSGNLRGGAAQGLIVYQTDGSQGLYFNTSQTATPAWVYLGQGADLNLNGFAITNVTHIDFDGDIVSVGRGANSYSNGVAIGYLANGTNYGAAVGWAAKGSDGGAAVGSSANGYNGSAAVGYQANGAIVGVAVGYAANGYDHGVAVGYQANGITNGAAMGYKANGSAEGVALGKEANGYKSGSALGYNANGVSNGTVIGRDAEGFSYGAAVGQDANGCTDGAAIGGNAKGYRYGVAVGCQANGANTNVAIGYNANAQGGTEQIAIGHNVTNNLPNTARIRGDLYLDGGSSIYTNGGVFGSADWHIKAFTIDHPLDPENKVLRHFCLEGPQVWNVYAGNAQLVNGQAVIELPDYYSALNLVGSEIYSLTVIGALAQIAVGKEVNENQFTIIGDKDVKVSWTIKVLRNDPGCLEDLRRRPVEQMKNEIR